MGRLREALFDITMSDEYEDDGESVTKSDFDANEVYLVDLTPKTMDGYIGVYDLTNEKVLVFQQNTTDGAFVQVAASTDLSSTVFRARVTYR